MRTVKVKLEADTQGFKEPVRSAKESIKDLDDKVEALDRDLDKVAVESVKAGAGVKEMGDAADKASTKTERLRDSSGRFVKAGTEMAETAHKAKDSVDDLKDKVEGLDHALGEVPADALRAAAALKLLKGDISEVERSIERVGDKSTAMTILDKRIAGARTEAKKLTEEFVKTGDVDIFKKLGQSQSNLSSLTKWRKQLEKDIENAGTSAFDKIGTSIEEILPKSVVTALSNPYIAAAAGVLAVTLGALIGAAIGGAITAAVAGGVVALGVAGAVQADPKRVGAAWDAEIARVKKQWLDASQSFVDPTIKAIHLIGAETAKVPLDSMFAKASNFIEPLAKGVAGFEHGLVGGVDALVDKAGPVIEVLKTEMPEVGHAIEMAFTRIAGGSQGAADGLRDILKLVEGGIVGFGEFVRNAEDLWHFIHQAADEADRLGGSVAWDPDKPKAYAVSLDGAAHGMDKYASETDKAKQATQELHDKIKDIDSAFSDLGKSVQGEFTDKIINQLLAMDDATIAWHDSLNKLAISVDKHGQSLDLNTDAGVRNQKAILNAVKANAELYQQNLLNKMSAEDAGRIYDQNSEQLRRSAIAAGYNAGEVDKLIGKYKNIPEKVQTILATIGLTDALNHLGQILIDFRNLNDKEFKTKYTITTTYITRTGTVGGKEGPALYAQGGLRKAAVGMFIPPSDPGTVLTGEPQTGGEWLIPSQGIGTSRAQSLLQMAGSNYGLDVVRRGGGAMKFEHTFNVAGDADSGLATWLMKAFRNGDVQVTSRAIVN